MRLQTFTVTNYRSITKAEKLDLTSFTVLVGPNNEGKSNILRAMVLGMRILDRAAVGIALTGRGARSSFRRVLSDEYSWERDYPLQLQKERREGRTSLRYDFLLTDEEVEAFRQETGSRINNELPIQIQIGSEQSQIQIPKKGPAKKALSSKRDVIAQFVGKRIDVAYIPAVRESSRSEDAARRILERELRGLEASEDYRAALKRIDELQRPTFDRVSRAIAQTLKEFIPDVSHVEVTPDAGERFRALRQSVSILIDDGYATDLSTKGDGVQSLAAVAMMRHLSAVSGGEHEVVLAIEEPESHLHPSAVHQLRDVLIEIAQKQQVVITTHSPLFVNRSSPTDNIVVQNNKARAAGGIEEVRAALGVHVSDNLRSANRVILVEGESDRRALVALFSEFIPAISDFVRAGSVAVEAIGGAGKLTYRLNRLRSDVCEAFVIMDADDSGRSAISGAVADGLLERTSTFLLAAPGQSQSELEDLVRPNLYAAEVEQQLGIVISGSRFTKQRSKWSQRMERVAIESGQLWDKATEKHAKQIVAEAVASEPRTAIHDGAVRVVENLAHRLASWLDLPAPSGQAEVEIAETN